MAELPQGTPPASAAGTGWGINQEVPKCPVCNRKLLTKASALCNWCGAKIDDPEHQAAAARERAEADHALRAKIEAEAQAQAQQKSKPGLFGIKRKVEKPPNKLLP